MKPLVGVVSSTFEGLERCEAGGGLASHDRLCCAVRCGATHSNGHPPSEVLRSSLCPAAAPARLGRGASDHLSWNSVRPWPCIQHSSRRVGRQRPSEVYIRSVQSCAALTGHSHPPRQPPPKQQQPYLLTDPVDPISTSLADDEHSPVAASLAQPVGSRSASERGSPRNRRQRTAR